MVIHMKTTLNISDVTMERLRLAAARQGKTMSALVDAALRKLLSEQAPVEDLPPLPFFKTGGARVDVADREVLYDVMNR